MRGADEITQLRAKLQAEQGDLSSYMEKQAKLSAQKADLEVQLAENEAKLAEEERMRAMCEGDKSGAEREMDSLKHQYQDVNARYEKLLAEKSKRDQILRGLNDDVLSQDEQISKLNKEKKYLQETVGKASDDLSVAADKVAHLNEVKSKLESTLDQMDDSLEKEKRMKYSGEKEAGGRSEDEPGVRLGPGARQEGAGELHPAQGDGPEHDDEQVGRRAGRGWSHSEADQGTAVPRRGNGGGVGGREAESSEGGTSTSRLEPRVRGADR